MRNGNWNLEVRIPVCWIFGLEKKVGLWTGDRESVHQHLDLSINNDLVRILKNCIKFQHIKCIGKIFNQMSLPPIDECLEWIFTEPFVD